MSTSVFDFGEAVKWLGVATAPVVAFLTTKVLGSASKDDLKTALEALEKQRAEDRRQFFEHCEEDSKRFAGLFNRAGTIANDISEV
ncbi:MAG TPA: hypothetical protein VFW03_13700, partial [Gemmatimonadaceae bacterium]|nr:hypothetical protein [Gemmatimonadaceae bacterium]